jgi:hypothetical protein
LRKLSLDDDKMTLLEEDQLPQNLHELQYEYTNMCFPSSCEEQPGNFEGLLALSRLERLHLEFWGGTAVAAEQLQQLSCMRSLQELRLSYQGCSAAEVEAAATVWHALPVKSLQWGSDSVICYEKWGLPAAAVQQFDQLQGLTQLALKTKHGELDRVELVEALQQCTRLQRLTVEGFEGFDHMLEERDATATIAAAECVAVGGGAACNREVRRSVDGVRAFLQAVGGLSMLEDVSVVLPVHLQETDVQQLQGSLQQVLPSRLLHGCRVHEDQVSVRLHGKQSFGQKRSQDLPRL